MRVQSFSFSPLSIGLNSVYLLYSLIEWKYGSNLEDLRSLLTLRAVRASAHARSCFHWVRVWRRCLLSPWSASLPSVMSPPARPAGLAPRMTLLCSYSVPTRLFASSGFSQFSTKLFSAETELLELRITHATNNPYAALLTLLTEREMMKVKKVEAWLAKVRCMMYSSKKLLAAAALI